MPPLIVILGPTASGKTQLATRLAHRLGGEILSADSRQVYRGMDIGTGKDLDEYQVQGTLIPHHLIDILDAGEKYHVHRFQQDFGAALAAIRARGSTPIVCGGTGLYLDAVLRGHTYTGIPVDDALRQELEKYPTEVLQARFEALPSAYSALADTSTRKRLLRALEIGTYLRQHPEYPAQAKVPRPDALIYGLDPPVALRRQRISRRLHQRLQNGLIEEVQQLLQRGLAPEQLRYYGLEYKWVTDYCTGDLPYAPMIQRLETEIHRFAKRQMTFFRKMERDGLPIRWLDHAQTPEAWLDQIQEDVRYLAPS
ncbi:tRNA (adenosine(37)-N6)-dimethylallyltransferase MiaA [Rhabdobacter roseus]|uniref:tRNA dimethylallyltransferase n=1 Tax=Rhabdobacter roseus TaxID=1655419 RepID=A0A840TTV9_9BACT|nr:tRNA (adenosine(37)-N6)-dimethylallyltransferase MiaA [Rhabdobacter roseus]MBB5283129.1 tRNA dimethylallyltransferase [Rhabdobacter roseus]